MLLFLYRKGEKQVQWYEKKGKKDGMRQKRYGKSPFFSDRGISGREGAFVI